MASNLSPADRANIKEVFKDIDHLLTQIEIARESIKEHIKALSSEFDIPKRTLNKMAKVYHAQSFHETQQEHEEFEDLYESVVNSQSSTADPTTTPDDTDE